MPTYEFKCIDCGYQFETFASMSEKTKGLNLKCPQCGSENLGEVFGAMIYLSKTGEIKTSGGCRCGSCG